MNPNSTTKEIAKSGVFKIVEMLNVGENDVDALIDVSMVLTKKYGDKSILTKSTIEKYFNRSGSISFIAIYQHEIIGYIIGIPIEKLSREPWARKDVNFGKSNTLYTYAFVIKETFFGNGYARILKKVFLSNVAKRKNLNFVTGHVISGRTAKFKGNISLIENVHNWQGTGLTFEYYRRIL